MNIPFFDGHNDTLLRLYLEKEDSFFSHSSGHLDFPRAQQAGFAAGFFAMFTPSKEEQNGNGDRYKTKEGYDIPLSPRVSLEDALKTTDALFALLIRLEKEKPERLQIARSRHDLETSLKNGRIAAIAHIEGAEAIDRDFNSLEVYYQAGLRSLGIVWSRSNDYGEGVPFRFPSSPDIGGGLTDAGKALVRECNRLGIMVDTTHLNEKGFWDVAAITEAPIVATHSNVHAITPISRNLTDRQIDCIAESGGVIGVNYAVNMVRPDGQKDPEISLDLIAKHIVYIAERAGVRHVAFGSDFDGTRVPTSLKDVTGVPKLLETLKTYGFNDDELKMIAYDNWLRVLSETWKN